MHLPRASRLIAVLGFTAVATLTVNGVVPFVSGAQPAPPSSEAPVPPGTDDELTPTDAVEGSTDSCAETALARRLSQWTCVGPKLVTPTGVEVLDAPARKPDPRLSGPGDVQTFDLPDPDDYDTWCENGTICSRLIPGLPGNPYYASETKGNVAYGDSDEVIGSYDHIIRTNLNGRQAQWNVTYIHDSGPVLNYPRAEVLCWEQVSGFPDSNCGVHYAGAPFTVSSTNRRFNSPTIYGERLEDSSTYYGISQGQVVPQGTGYQFAVPHLETKRFNCFGTDRCFFP